MNKGNVELAQPMLHTQQGVSLLFTLAPKALSLFRMI